jgi:O-antigen/teichoic acid export membrane protein
MTRISRYIRNVAWNSASVLVLLLVGFVLSPFILRHIGEKNYGEWTLVLSLVEYYWLIDFGFRSATIKFSAEYGALNDDNKLSELVSTGLIYSSLGGLIIALISIFLADHIAVLLHVQQPEFPNLLRIVGVSWGLGMVFNIFSGCIEGFQRFDTLSRIWMLTTVVRAIWIVIVLSAGYSVLAMSWVLFGVQLMSYLVTWWQFHRIAPQVRVSWERGSRTMLRIMAAYGVHTLTAHVAVRVMNYSVPVVIAYFLPIEYLAYWSIPVRTMEYAFDGIGRIGMVTTPNATELAAKGEFGRLQDLGIYSNRYCFALFAPFAMFLLVYGRELYSLWIKKPDFVAHSVFLLPILLIGYTAIAGQFNSVSILFGLGRHQLYVRCLLADSILAIVGIALVLPHYGLAGAAWVITILMTLTRAVLACYLLARELRVNPWKYAARIYTRPGLLAAGMLLSLWAVKTGGVRGSTPRELLALAAVAGVLYILLAVPFVLAPYHREHILQRFMSMIRIKPAAAQL